MRILIDTDVLLDVGLNRPRFVDRSLEVLNWSERTEDAAIAWHSLSNCAYILKREGRTFLTGLLRIVRVADVGHENALVALSLGIPDFEDALQVAAAQSWNSDWIVTRNISHFKKSPIPALSPTDFLKTVS